MNRYPNFAAPIGRLIARYPRGAMAAALGIVAVAAFALYWLAPWRLFVDRRVDEALPGAVATTVAPESADSPPAAAAPTEGVATLAQGDFSSLEHETTGAAIVVQAADGARYIRLENLQTSDGPDLRVILTDQPVSDDWYVWDDSRYVDLGPLKGNVGSANYAIPSETDLADYRTAVIWCRRFGVGFGVAPLDPVP